MKRAKAERWEETHRREVGVVTGDVPRTGANFTILYMVTECRKTEGRVAEWRERLVPGVTLYQVAQATYCNATMLEVVAKGVKALSDMARDQDDRTSAAKRATSRRKAR